MDQDGQPSIHEDDHRGIVTTALGGSTWNRAQQPLHDAGVSCGRLCAAAVWWMLWEDWGFGVDEVLHTIGRRMIYPPCNKLWKWTVGPLERP